MIYEIGIDNIDILDGTFIDKDYIINELKNNPFAVIKVLEENKKIIGYIYYSDIYDRAEINQIEIERIHRNCGKGNFLLRNVIESVDKSFTLEVNKNNISAIRLYEKNGFEKKAIRKNYYNGVDGILMERK